LRALSLASRVGPSRRLHFFDGDFPGDLCDVLLVIFRVILRLFSWDLGLG
jgi:hypothetical protein